MLENSQIPVEVRKADATIADLSSGGGLVREQLRKYILVAIKASVMMGRVRVATMERNQQEIPKMTTFGTQVWFPGTESQALLQAQRSAPGYSRVILTSTEVVCQVDFPRYTLKAQVEGPQWQSTMLAYLAQHTNQGWDNLICNGDTTSTNTFLRLFNGIIAGITTYTYSGGAANLNSTILRRIQLTLPSEFRSQNLAFYTNDWAWSSYDDELASRGTVLGDQRQVSGGTLMFKGKEVVEVPLFPNNLNSLGGSNETAVCYMDAKNFIFAFEEGVEVQSEYNIRTRNWTVVMTARIAQDFEHEPACVEGTGILGQ